MQQEIYCWAKLEFGKLKSSQFRTRQILVTSPPRVNICQRKGVSVEPQAGVPDLLRAGVEPENQAAKADCQGKTRATGSA